MLDNSLAMVVRNCVVPVLSSYRYVTVCVHTERRISKDVTAAVMEVPILSKSGLSDTHNV
jgi:hypothetical protein